MMGKSRGWIGPAIGAGAKSAMHPIRAADRLGGAIAALSLMQAVPALGNWSTATRPDWVYVVLLIAALQMAYAIWMLLVPDWSTVWVAMLALAGVATAYAMAIAVTLVTPANDAMILGLDEFRGGARLWCGLMAVLCCAAAYSCGYTSSRWRKAERIARDFGF